MMKKRLFNLIIAVCVTHSLMAQLVSLGLVEESAIEQAEKAGIVSKNYIPKLKMVEGYLYAGTPYGLYQWKMKGMDNSGEWIRFAFTENTPIHDFEVRGDTLVVATPKHLFLSTDKGQTVKDISLTDFGLTEEQLNDASFSAVAIHPDDAKKISITYPNLYYTEDSGETWKQKGRTQKYESYSNTFLNSLCYHPLDSLLMLGYTYSPMIDTYAAYISQDGGKNWNLIGGIYDGYIYGFAFHPTNKNKIIVYGAGSFAMTEDEGATWRTLYKEGSSIKVVAYLYDVVFDKRQPEVLYGAELPKEKYSISVQRSTDGGFTWNDFFAEKVKNVGGILSICISDNVLALYSYANGIYLLDVDAVDTSVEGMKIPATDAPLFDLLGRCVSQPTKGIYIQNGRKRVFPQRK